jgi:acyl-CoA thioesterase FadM
MNLYVRLLWTVLKALRAPRLNALEAFELELRVLPNDIDINGHLNNARYLAFVDLALCTLFVRSGFGRLCIERKWRPMAGGSVIHYRRALQPFQTFTLRFTPVAWDEYWNYSRFEFIREGQVCANGFTKGAAVGKQGLVRSAQLYEALGQRVTSPPMPKDLAAWVASDALLGVQAKRANADAQRASN